MPRASASGFLGGTTIPVSPTIVAASPTSVTTHAPLHRAALGEVRRRKKSKPVAVRRAEHSDFRSAVPVDIHGRVERHPCREGKAAVVSRRQRNHDDVRPLTNGSCALGSTGVAGRHEKTHLFAGECLMTPARAPPRVVYPVAREVVHGAAGVELQRRRACTRAISPHLDDASRVPLSCSVPDSPDRVLKSPVPPRRRIVRPRRTGREVQRDAAKVRIAVGPHVQLGDRRGHGPARDVGGRVVDMKSTTSSTVAHS